MYENTYNFVIFSFLIFCNGYIVNIYVYYFVFIKTNSFWFINNFLYSYIITLNSWKKKFHHPPTFKVHKPPPVFGFNFKKVIIIIRRSRIGSVDGREAKWVERQLGTCFAVTRRTIIIICMYDNLILK